MLAGIIYTMCALTAFFCAYLLLRAYRCSDGYKTLLWGGLCFVGLTLSNVLLVVDKLLTPPEVDLSTYRHLLSLAAMIVLLYGLINEKEDI